MFIVRLFDLKNKFFRYDHSDSIEKTLVYEASLQFKLQEKNKGWVDRAQIRFVENISNVKHSIVAFDSVFQSGQSYNLLTVIHYLPSDIFNYLLEANSAKIEISITIDELKSQNNVWKNMGQYVQWDSSIASVDNVDRLILDIRE